MGLILISHDLALVAEYCDRVAVMYEGQLVELGTSQQVLQQPEHAYTQSLLKSAIDLQQADIRDEISQTAAPLLEVENLQKHYTLEANPLARLFGQQAAKTSRTCRAPSCKRSGVTCR